MPVICKNKSTIANKVVLLLKKKIPISILGNRYGNVGRRIWLMAQGLDYDSLKKENKPPKSFGHGKVTIPGFGTFEVRHRNARMGRNPQTGAAMHIPASKVPGFKAGKGLKDKVKNS